MDLKGELRKLGEQRRPKTDLCTTAAKAQPPRHSRLGHRRGQST
jgi:hypothetical protein